MTYQNERFTGAVNELYGIIDLALNGVWGRYVAAHILNCGGLELNLLHLGSLGEVKHHGARTARACNIKGACHCPGDIIGAAYLIAPLGDRLGYTHQVNLLEGIGTQGIGSHLAGNHHDGGAVKHGIADAGDGVGGAGAAGHDGHTCAARYAGVTLCGMGGSLLVTHQYLVQVCAVAVECIEHLDD